MRTDFSFEIGMGGTEQESRPHGSKPIALGPKSRRPALPWPIFVYFPNGHRSGSLAAEADFFREPPALPQPRLLIPFMRENVVLH
jgi:hypothetical protein